MSTRGFSIALAFALAAVALIGACERQRYWRDQTPSKPVTPRNFAK